MDKKISLFQLKMVYYHYREKADEHKKEKGKYYHLEKATENSADHSICPKELMQKKSMHQ
jgi:hypothetical protein